MATIQHIKDFDVCCRTCLNYSSVQMYSIFEERNNCLNLAEMLSSCTTIKASIEDRLPKQLCASCYNSVVNFYDFRKIAEKIDKTLHEHFKDQNLIGNVDDVRIKIENDSTSDNYSDDEFNKTEVEINFVDTYLKRSSKHVDELTQTKVPLKLHKGNDSKESHLDNVTCDKKVKAKHKLDPHVKHKKNYKCSVCSKVFNHRDKCIKHLMEHRQDAKLKSVQTDISQKDNPSVQCDICGNNYPSINSLSAHKRKHAKKGRVLSCSLCHKIFNKISHLKRHELCHDHNRPYKCSECKKSFASESILIEHVNKHSGINHYGCPICSKRFAHRSTLNNHIKIHTRGKPYLCPTCGKRFDSSTNLNQHVKRHTGLRMYACDLCPKTFVTKGELKRHGITHTGVRSYVCDICNASFNNSSTLRNHNRMHLGIKPYPCDLCPMKFRSNYHLQRHHRIHSGERPYRCDMCERAFTQSNDLEKHRRAHLGNDLYKCAQCSQSFRLKTELRQHISEHFISSQLEKLSVANNNIRNVAVLGQNDKGTQEGCDVPAKSMVVDVGNEQ